MSGKQAKVLSASQIDCLLAFAETTRQPVRDRVIVLLSVKAGLRAGEIANLTWDMVLDSAGDIGAAIELHDWAAKKGGDRLIPVHADLVAAPRALRAITPGIGPVIQSARGGAMRPVSIVNWFAGTYRATGLDGCSSRSGRRTFITRAAACRVHQPAIGEGPSDPCPECREPWFAEVFVQCDGREAWPCRAEGSTLGIALDVDLHAANKATHLQVCADLATTDDTVDEPGSRRAAIDLRRVIGPAVTKI
jgi:hypothetical protein